MTNRTHDFMRKKAEEVAYGMITTPSSTPRHKDLKTAMDRIRAADEMFAQPDPQKDKSEGPGKNGKNPQKMPGGMWERKFAVTLPKSPFTLSGNEASEFVSDMLSEEKQVQPTGIDLTVGKIFVLTGKPIIGFNESIIPKMEPFDSDGYGYNLEPGVYLVRLAETVEVVMPYRARLYPRTTLLRCGCALGSGIFDPGYKGKPVVLLQAFGEVYIEERARICNIEFYPAIPGPEYDGHYQGEGLK